MTRRCQPLPLKVWHHRLLNPQKQVTPTKSYASTISPIIKQVNMLETLIPSVSRAHQAIVKLQRLSASH